MDEVIKLRAKSEKEVEQMAKNILHLKENETFEIMVLKKPKKFLFFNIEGEYEIRVVDKKKKQERVFNMTCGSGSLLLNVRKQMKDSGGTIGKI